MNSLRTDDILGAKPRVRHMPMNLIRQRQVPTSFLTNLQPTNPEWSPSSYQPSSPNHIEQSNNSSNGYPFYALNNLTKASRLVNYDFIGQENLKKNNGNHVNYQSESRQMSRVESEQRYKHQSRGREINYLNQSVQIQTDKQQINKDEVLSRKSEAISRKSVPISRRSQGSSHHSAGSQERRAKQQEEGKRIFRGLGFNIISNHKYEYLLEQGEPK